MWAWPARGAGPVGLPARALAAVNRHRTAIFTLVMWLRAVLVAAHFAPSTGDALMAALATTAALGGALCGGLAATAERALHRRFRLRRRVRRRLA